MKIGVRVLHLLAGVPHLKKLSHLALYRETEPARHAQGAEAWMASSLPADGKLEED